MDALIATAASKPDTHALVFLGIGLILGSLFLRRIISFIEYMNAPQGKGANVSDQASSK